jgi:cytochrome c oxidase cbb3-type subunit 3
MGLDSRPDRRNTLAAAAVGIGALVMAAAGVQAIHASSQYATLMRGDPDLIATQPALATFAAGAAKPVFARQCAGCHGADMRGDRSRGVPDLTDQDWLYGSGRPVEVERTILYGVRASQPRTWNLADMPAFGQAAPYRRYKVAPLRPGDIRDVVEFIRVLERKPADPAMAGRGSKVFADTGQCFDCHASDGAGDPAIGGPNLQDDVWLYGDGSRDSVFKSIAHGHAGVCPAWSKRLKAGEVRALSIYIANSAKGARPAANQAALVPPKQGRTS